MENLSASDQSDGDVQDIIDADFDHFRSLLSLVPAAYHAKPRTTTDDDQSNDQSKGMLEIFFYSGFFGVKS